MLFRSGNTTQVNHIFNVSDDIDPVITCPTGPFDKNINTGFCTYTSNSNEFDPVLSNDNCTVSSVLHNYIGGGTTLNGQSFPVGSTTVTWTITDICGNTASCSITINVSDNQAPTITCPSNYIVNTAIGSCTKSVSTSNPTIWDNCSVTKLTWSMTGATVANSPQTGINYIGTYTFNIGTTTVTYNVYDAAGNSQTCSFTVKVNDNQNPVISCPSYYNEYTNPGQCYTTIATSNPTFGDNCGVTKLTWVISGVTTGNSLNTGINYLGTYNFNKGVSTVTYYAFDAAGNYSACSFTVTVIDNQKPTITCPSNYNVNNDPGNCSKSVLTSNPTTSDNCGVTKLTWTMTGATSANSPLTGINNIGTYTFNVGTTTITYIVYDAAGNFET